MRNISMFAVCAMMATVGYGQEKTQPERLEKKPLDISIQQGAFKGAQEADVKAVVMSAANAIWQYVPHGQMPQISVGHAGNAPITLYSHDAQGRLVINLCTEKTYWSQYSYQFSHEFCHGMAGHALPYTKQAESTSRENFWLEESICEMASYFAMRDMAKSWETNAPYPNWKSYSKSLKQYIDDHMSASVRTLPEGMSFTAWMNENQAAMRENSTIRDNNSIVAKQLLPIFEADPKGWEAIQYKNRVTVVKDQSLKQYLQSWHDACPADLQPFVKKIMEVFKDVSEKAVVKMSEPSSKLELVVDDGVWGKGAKVDVKAVLDSVVNSIWQYCPNSKIRPIAVKKSDSVGMDNELDARGNIVVKLSARDTYWCQYSYQFSHELGRVLASQVEPDAKQWQNASASMEWFEESLFETATIFALQSMAKSWQVKAPYDHWKSYSSSIQAYVDGITNPAKEALGGKEFLAWFKENEASLKEKAKDRKINAVIATQLVTVFNSDPKTWEAVTYLRRTKPVDNETLTDLLKRWYKSTPEALQPNVKKIADVFAVKMD